METGLNSLKPGGNVDSWCGKCKMVLAHTIEAMVGIKPARVNCNTCRSQHTYKANAPGTSTRARTRAPGTTPRAGKSAANRYQSLLNSKNATAAKNYSPQNKYEAGDVLAHPTFGLGVLTLVKDDTKIEVLFETGPKLLVHAR